MAVPYHPPAAGGKTAWGVGDLITKTGEDVEELQRRKKGAQEFNDREQKRLHSLKDMDSLAADIQESRRERARNWEMSLTTKGADDFKSKQLEILRKLEENKAQRKLEKQERMKAEGTVPKKKPPKKKKKDSKKKKKKKESSSSSSGSSSGSSSSSSSSGDKKEKVQKSVPVVPPKPVELTPEQKAQQLALKRKAEEAKAKEREVKRKAKEMLAASNAEAKQKEAEDQADRQAEAKRRALDAESKKKAEARQKKEEEEAKKKAEEEKKEEAKTARKKAAEEAASKVKSLFAIKKDVREKLAGGFYEGQHVVATQDITVNAKVIVRNGTAGTVTGRADTDPANRVAVKFVPRTDGGTGKLNCAPREIRKG